MLLEKKTAQTSYHTSFFHTNVLSFGRWVRFGICMFCERKSFDTVWFVSWVSTVLISVSECSITQKLKIKTVETNETNQTVSTLCLCCVKWYKINRIFVSFSLENYNLFILCLFLSTSINVNFFLNLSQFALPMLSWIMSSLMSICIELGQNNFICLSLTKFDTI